MRTLNNIFYDEFILQEFRTYLLNKQNYQNPEFKNKFQKEPFTKFELKNNQIIYKPKNLIVIENEDQKEKVFDDLFNDDNNTIGKGVVGFYKYVISKYIGITRQDVENYMATKGFYQMTQNITKRINKPIISKYPNQMWGIDLIDMNEYIKQNKGWRYIMTVVDIFSRKVFLNKLKFKEARNTSMAFQQIMNKADIQPKYLMSDRGKEWLGEFETMCNQNNIKQLFTRSYSPEANGVVERMNKEIRKIIKAFFLRNNNKIWNTILDKVEENKNNTFNSTIKNTPNDVWTSDQKEISQRPLPETFAENNPKLQAKISLIKKAMAKVKKYKELDNFKEDDIVRVKMSSIFSNVRKLVKDGNTKQIVVTYTPELFRVNRVIIPRNKLLERKRYTLENEDGKIVKINNVAKQFYASELLLFEGEDDDIDISMDMALKLNGVQRNANDVEY